MEMTMYEVFEKELPVFDVVENPFCTNIIPQLILYPTEVCMLSKKQHQCLQMFLKQIGEDEYFVTDSFKIAEKKEPKVFNGSTTHEELMEECLLPVTLFYSCHATWGIVVSDDEYAIVGVVEDYIPKLMNSFEPCISEWECFSKNFATRSDLPNFEQNCCVVEQVLAMIGLKTDIR